MQYLITGLNLNIILLFYNSLPIMNKNAITTTSSPKAAQRASRDTSIFVGGIMRTVTEQDIRWYFEQFGPIFSVTLIPDPKNPTMNKGFCFLSFKSEETKEKALHVKDHIFMNRKITCTSLLKGKKLKEEVTKSTQKKLCVKNIPKKMTEVEFKELFSEFGQIHSVYMVMYKNSKSHAHNAYLVYEDDAVFDRLIRMKSVNYKGKILRIERFSKRDSTQDFSEQLKTDLSSVVSQETERSHSMKPTKSHYFHHLKCENRIENEGDSNLRFNPRMTRRL